MWMLSKYFSYDEMTKSSYAKRHGLDNKPTSSILSKLVETSIKMDKVRELLVTPIIVNSAYRSLAVNRGIGSKDTSQHTKGEAVDFITHKYTPRQIYDIIRKSDIEYDQLILEYNAWVHISFSARNRRQVLIIDNKGTRHFN